MKHHVKKINETVAIKATLAMSTMWCVYFFTIWALIPLVIPSLQTFVFYVSGGIIQLSALPLIMVGQNVLSRKSEHRAEKDHKMIMDTLKEIRTMHAEMHAKIDNLPTPE